MIYSSVHLIEINNPLLLLFIPNACSMIGQGQSHADQINNDIVLEQLILRCSKFRMTHFSNFNWF